MAASDDSLNTAWEIVSNTLTPERLPYFMYLTLEEHYLSDGANTGVTSHYLVVRPLAKGSMFPDYIHDDILSIGGTLHNVQKGLPACPGEFERAVDVLCENNLGFIIEEWFVDRIQQDLRQRVAPQFWAVVEKYRYTDCILCMKESVEVLHNELCQFSACVVKVNSIRAVVDARPSSLPSLCKPVQHRDLNQFTLMLFKAVIFHTVPSHFHDIINKFYAKAIKVFHQSKAESEEECEEERADCPGCELPRNNCHCEEIIKTFHKVNSQLGSVGLLEKLSGAAITSLTHQRIQQHVQEKCQGNFEVSYIHTLEQWLEGTILDWLHTVYSGYHSDTHQSGNEHVQAFKGRLLHLVYETYARLRIDQLFNIIIEYPDSEPALQDLRTCLEKTDLRSHLTCSLRLALESRLLHPGVNTADILTAYISAIRALRVLDPVGVILELVCEPVRRYLRSRGDTVRCIVSSLTDEGNNELSDELVKGQPLVLEDTSNSDDETEDWATWMPDPVDADLADASKSRRASDIISILVNIYGSKELFVNEYRTLLADRILTLFNYETEREIRYLELLKLMFGEAQLHYCEVMLKDVADSRRINGRISEERSRQPAQDGVAVNAMILSAQFWPPFREEKITLPDQLEKGLLSYTKQYEALKGNRTLTWKPHLGLLNIDIELKDRTLNFTVSPVHAAIIMQFQNQVRWSVDELSCVLQMPVSALRRKITYWQSQGLLREETPDVYHLMEEHKGPQQEVILPEEEEEAESAMASAHAQREEQFQMFWSYIVGMLTSLESLTLERIHSVLKMFAMQGPTTSEFTLQELKSFLDTKVKEQQLICTSGIYRLAK